MSVYDGPKISTNGLVLALDAGNRLSYVSGSTLWNDISNNNNNGTLINGPTFNTANGGSIVFDGVDDYVNLTPTSFTIGISPFTIGGWFNVDTTSTNYGCGITFGSGNVGRQFWIGYVTTAQYGTNNTLGGGGYGRNLGSGIPPDNNFHSVYAISSGGSTPTVSIYVDGIFKISSSFAMNIYESGSKIGIGDDNGNLNYRLKGRTSSFQIYNRALSAQEVLQNFNAQKSRFGL